MAFERDKKTMLDRVRAARARIPAVVTVDFETEGIRPRPDYPPEPVGVALYEPGRNPEYLAWGHPSENNCDRQTARRRLRDVWTGRRPLLFHHAQFDLEVGAEKLGLPLTPAAGFYCTELLAFLANPHAERLALKPLSEELLGIPSDERDELRAWIFAHVPECRGKPKTWRGWGAFISCAPGGLVGKYSIGDVTRTRKLFDLLYPYAISEMRPAVEREHALSPLLIKLERGGMPVDLPALERDVRLWARWLDAADDWLRRRLMAPSLDVDSNDELADALEKSGVVTDWKLTKKGNRSTARAALEESVSDPEITHLLGYRGRLATSLRTFGMPWWTTASRTGGLVYFGWNQVRSENGAGRTVGARTGRLSSQPNAQNIPNAPKDVALPPPLDQQAVGPLPLLRRYVRAPRGTTLLNRDYSQQELRILAHYEDGALLRAYHADPKLDVHEHAQRLINGMLGTSFERKPVKNTGFGLIYGMGVGKLARTTGIDEHTARKLQQAYLSIFPGLRALRTELSDRGKLDEPIKTWGGRVYYVEPPKAREDGTTWTFEYKLINTLIQGSAADCTKQAIINWFALQGDADQMLLTVHDEFLNLAPSGDARGAMARMRRAMEEVKFDLPMLSDGKVGRVWSEMEEEPKSWRDDS